MTCKGMLTKRLMETAEYRELINILRKLDEGDNHSRARARRLEKTVLKLYSCVITGRFLLPFYFA